MSVIDRLRKGRKLATDPIEINDSVHLVNVPCDVPSAVSCMISCEGELVRSGAVGSKLDDVGLQVTARLDEVLVFSTGLTETETEVEVGINDRLGTLVGLNDRRVS